MPSGVSVEKHNKELEPLNANHNIVTWLNQKCCAVIEEGMLIFNIIFARNHWPTTNFFIYLLNPDQEGSC